MKDRYNQILTATVILIVLIFLTLVCGLQDTQAAYAAAPYQPRTICNVEDFQQKDMAGTYEQRDLLLIMYPCGSSLIAWTNAYGEHVSGYYSWDRVPGGGVVAYGFYPDPEINAYLDTVRTIMIKPAEPGWVQLMTITDEDVIRRIYRLKKTE